MTNKNNRHFIAAVGDEQDLEQIQALSPAETETLHISRVNDLITGEEKIFYTNATLKELAVKIAKKQALARLMGTGIGRSIQETLKKNSVALLFIHGTGQKINEVTYFVFTQPEEH